MRTNTKQPDGQPRIQPHLIFEEMSNRELELNEGLIEERIAWGKEDGDELVVSWYRCEMSLLQAERARRNGKANQPPENVSLRLQDEALHGLAGEIVRAIAPHTEADPVALLLYLLSKFGNIIAHNAHWRMERTLHYLNLFTVLVGDTSRGRKGTSRSTLDYVFTQLDRSHRVSSGLSSGQGLIWHVRDPIMQSQLIKEKGKVIGYQDVTIDKGSDVEEEFSSVLRLTAVEGNILSATIREAWDSGNLETLVSGRKSNPVRATDAHISIVGHVTKQELLRYLDSTEQANGFGNRFLWALVEGESPSSTHPAALLA